MSGRISALKKEIDKLRVKIIVLKMTPRNEYLESLKNEILSLKQEGQCKQVTIDALEFDMDRTEKKLLGADEIIIKLGKEIELLKIREQCSKDDIAVLVDELHISSRDLKNAYESIVTLNANIKSLEDKKIKNRLKKLLVG